MYDKRVFHRWEAEAAFFFSEGFVQPSFYILRSRPLRSVLAIANLPLNTAPPYRGLPAGATRATQTLPVEDPYHGSACLSVCACLCRFFFAAMGLDIGMQFLLLFARSRYFVELLPCALLDCSVVRRSFFFFFFSRSASAYLRLIVQ